MVDVKGTKVGKGKTTSGKVHAGRYVHDEAYNEEQHDMGPWIEVTSTRVDSLRFDYQNRAIQVRWANKSPSIGTIYLETPYERFRAFVRASSKGKFVNSSMTHNYEFRYCTPEELNAPTNERRSSFGMGRRDAE